LKQVILFTIGYEKKTIEKFFGELTSNKIRALIDIRANPVSRKPGFSKKKLQSNCESQGILYFHFPEAGIPSFYRKELKSTGSYDELFDWYSSNLKTIPGAIQQIIGLVYQYSRVVLTCFESDVNLCHRKPCGEFIEKKINSESFRLIHI